MREKEDLKTIWTGIRFGLESILDHSETFIYLICFEEIILGIKWLNRFQ